MTVVIFLWVLFTKCQTIILIMKWWATMTTHQLHHLHSNTTYKYPQGWSNEPLPWGPHRKSEVYCPTCRSLCCLLDVVRQRQPPRRNPGHQTATLQKAHLSSSVLWLPATPHRCQKKWHPYISLLRTPEQKMPNQKYLIHRPAIPFKGY